MAGTGGRPDISTPGEMGTPGGMGPGMAGKPGGEKKLTVPSCRHVIQSIASTCKYMYMQSIVSTSKYMYDVNSIYM